jgi:hypothetical protein
MTKLFRILNYIIPEPLLIALKHYKYTGSFPNIFAPKTLSEKILWLKCFDRRDWHKFYADKIVFKELAAARIGAKYVIKTLGIFEKLEDAQKALESIPFPYVIKPNHDCGGGYIVRSADDLRGLSLKDKFENRLRENYFINSREYQYNGIKPKIFVEKLLVCRNGRIPHDYKIHVINGRAAFVYCSIDREGLNYRKLYTLDWKELPVTWEREGGRKSKFVGPNIPRPENLDEMISLAEVMAIGFCYVRVDFYDVDGLTYIGELTQHHSGGNDVIRPREFDLFYGKNLQLKKSPVVCPIVTSPT